MPFQSQAKQPADFEYKDPGSSKSRPPEAFRDPSEHILSGKGSTLQHARSVYSQGPVEILPGLFLGDEHNARDSEMLSDLGITTVLNVAKETVLPFQLEANTSPLRVKASNAWPEASSNSGAPPPVVRLRKESDDFFTPPTTAYPTASELAKANEAPSSASSSDWSSQQPSPHNRSAKQRSAYPPSASPVSASYLRNTASTPNLLSRFKKVSSSESPIASAGLAEEDEQDSANQGQAAERDALTEGHFFRYSDQRRGSSDSSEEAYDNASSPSSRADTCTSSATELTPPAPNSSGVGIVTTKMQAAGVDAAPAAFIATGEQHGEDRSDITGVDLPSNAIALKVPASPISARMTDLRYIKLPWTHDETDLAAPGGGFTHGCAIIAEALGIDSRVWDPSTVADDTSVLPLLFQGDRVDKLQSGSHKGKVLVHCQCGVSRSATLVIAFVMQAAALRYGFEESRALMGMHDCYNMVKEKSASISPNISLIYQLVEWERQLSKAASRLREALGGAAPDTAVVAEAPAGEAGSRVAGAGGSNPGWSVEVLDEEKWSQMRLEEEQKEAEEEQRRKDERLAEAKRAMAERKAASDRLEGKSTSGSAGGDGLGGGSLMQRRRKVAPALQLKTVTGSAAGPLPPRPSKHRPPMLNLKSQSSAQDEGQAPPETPFLTAKTNAWRPHEHMRSGSSGSVDFDKDVVMASVDSPAQAPSDVRAFGHSGHDDQGAPSLDNTVDQDGIVTPQMASASTPSGAESDVRMTSPPPQSTRPSSMSGALPQSSTSPDGQRKGSVAMTTSLSSSSGRSRFSFGGIAAAFTPSGKRRPGSMAASSGGAFTGSPGLFGAMAQSKEERRKQHRRTFSSDLPALRAGLELEKLVIPPGKARGPVSARENGNAGSTGSGLSGSTSISETLLRGDSRA
ncbi:uncharacterized protein PFL1_04966 [Pseudozyma flocculosa PF-1]|uniref:protein-tyrosine-phosphatase n=1 Tax=Pseudozyma flocculosa PF-1 TaxID=1277687 RepID=A0A061H4C2_9BASI|nr:uncharacterized protein PFL1_04966 [Pseudozyma flocculosa PF-1]EPQ27428.1 hypothetical protein PFL1_04966 [Pseudozyma flocculosa PF-1]